MLNCLDDKVLNLKLRNADKAVEIGSPLQETLV